MSNLAYRKSVVLKANAANASSADFASSYTVTAYSVGAVANGAQTGVSTITVHTGHGVVTGDKIMVGSDTTKFFVAGTVTTTTIPLDSGTVDVSDLDLIVNLGADTGTTAPNFDGSKFKIYEDPLGDTAYSNSTVTCDAQGEFAFWHKGDGAHWEIAKTGSTVEDVRSGKDVGSQANVVDYGASGDGVTDDSARIQSACDSGASTVVFPGSGTFLIASDTAIAPASSTTLTGKGTIKRASGAATASIFDLTAKTHVCFDGVVIDGNSVTSGYGAIAIDGASSSIRVTNCRIYDCYSCVWVKQGTQITIDGCDLSDASHIVYIGANTVGGGGDVTGVLINNNQIYSAKAYGDGIKLIKDCKKVSITGNNIHSNPGDGVDCFVSGNELTISGNVIRNNTVQGIDIKSDEVTYPPETWGKNKNMVVCNNVITDNTRWGIKIWRNGDDDWPHGIAVSNNFMTNNGYGGVACRAPNCTISANVIIGNGLTYTSNSYGVYVFGTGSGEAVRNVSLIGNVIVNNGHPDEVTNYGVNLQTAEYVSVVGNVLDSDSDLDNNFQQYGLAIGSDCSDIIVSGNSFGDGLTGTVVDSSDSVDQIGNVGVGTVFRNGVTSYALNTHFRSGADTQNFRQLYAQDENEVQEWRMLERKSSTGYYWSFYDASNVAINSPLVYSTVDGRITLNNVETVTAFTAADATPSVSGGNLFTTGGAVTITDFDDGAVGQTITIKAGHAVTITHGASTIQLSGGFDFSMSSGDTLTLTMFASGVWTEVGRMAA